MNMIERVARAMFNHDEDQSDQWGWDQDPPRDWDSDNIEECERDAYRRGARAAIEAMREPTEVMDKAAWKVGGPPYIWKAMIDAALVE